MRSALLIAALAAAARAFAPLPSPPRAATRAQAFAPSTLLWDCDGTLADTEKDGHRVAFNKAFVEYGIAAEWSVAAYGELLHVGGGKERMTAYFEASGWPTDAVVAKAGGRPELIKSLHLRKTALFNEIVEAGGCPLREGVLDVVDAAAAAGLRLAVCSTSSEAAVRTVVRSAMGDDRYAKFDFFCGDMVKEKKPSPAIYNMAAAEMSVDPADVLVFEDTNIGLRAAVAAGMKCVVTTNAYTEAEDFTGAAAKYASLGGVGLAQLLEDVDGGGGGGGGGASAVPDDPSDPRASLRALLRTF